jgi:transposase InsO family protein
MREYIRLFIQRCPCCQKMSVLKTPIHTMPYTTSCDSPMDTLNIDTMGPFPKDAKGNCFIIVIIDKFTRVTELYPEPSTDAESAADALLQHTGTYGLPNKIQSDNGPQYLNKTIKELCELTGLDHTTTMAYSKEENAIVERQIKEVLRHLRALVFEVGSTKFWSKYIPLIKRIINSTVHESIGVAPATLLFGNSINLDRGIFLPHETSNNITNKLSEWAQRMLLTQKDYLKSLLYDNLI